ncbi:MAG: helix-turn-helix domain-containing protein [Candidatus Omnitrophota bacterium]
MNKLMNITELAEYLRLKRQTIYNWLHQRKISGIKVGGVWRFDRRDIDLWLKEKRRV